MSLAALKMVSKKVSSGMSRACAASLRMAFRDFQVPPEEPWGSRGGSVCSWRCSRPSWLLLSSAIRRRFTRSLPRVGPSRGLQKEGLLHQQCGHDLNDHLSCPPGRIPALYLLGGVVLSGASTGIGYHAAITLADEGECAIEVDSVHKIREHPWPDSWLDLGPSKSRPTRAVQAIRCMRA